MIYEFLDHTADIKFRAYGKTIVEAFENSVLAVSNYITRGEKIKSKKGKVIEIKGKDKESLFYNLLEEIIVLLDRDNFVVKKAEIVMRGNNLTVEFYGDNAGNYNFLDHIKAATYSEMYIKKTSKGWEVQAVLDV